MNTPTSQRPTVSKLTPTEGPEAGKTVVVIEGTSLGAANTVRFGGIAATTFKVNSATSITATAPPGKGTVAVTVTAPGGTSGEVPADLYTYDAVPTVAKVTPAEGPDAGNTVITIEGTGLSTATAVRFGGVAAAAFKATSATSITATAPAGAGIAAVTVTTPGGTSAETPADLYTYDAVPTVTSLSVKEGPLAGGTKVTITGTGFTAGSTVSFGATKAKASTFISATELSAESPAGTGAAAVTVETPGGKSAEVPADTSPISPPPRSPNSPQLKAQKPEEPKSRSQAPASQPARRSASAQPKPKRAPLSPQLN